MAKISVRDSIPNVVDIRLNGTIGSVSFFPRILGEALVNFVVLLNFRIVVGSNIENRHIVW